LRKVLVNRANRHLANQQLAYEAIGVDDNVADEIESRVKHKPPKEWRKYPDRPLGEVVARKIERRVARQKLPIEKL